MTESDYVSLSLSPLLYIVAVVYKHPVTQRRPNINSEPLTVTSNTGCKAQNLIMMNAIPPGIFGLFVQGLNIVLVLVQPTIHMAFFSRTPSVSLVVMLRCS